MRFRSACLPLFLCAWGCSYDWRIAADGGSGHEAGAQPAIGADAADLGDATEPDDLDVDPEDDPGSVGQAGDAGGLLAADAAVSAPGDASASDAKVTLDASPVATPDAGAADAAGSDAAMPEVDSGPLLFWYRDCDEDGYAATKVGRQQAATKPQETVDCFGWTTREPADLGSTDCDDANAYRHPGAAAGLPISASGQALPPAGDIAYDLDCDGSATAQFTAWSTGNVRDGALELIELCPEMVSCVGRTSPCMLSFRFSGVPSCGVRYGRSTDFACVNTPGFYFLCH